MKSLFKPLDHKPLMAKELIDPTYRRLRWQVFMGIFIGYAAYYFVRKNFALAMPFLIEEQGYTRGELGIALSAISLSYGVSKFVMGSYSDRSNPRYFLTVGLILASLCILLMGLFPWATSSVAIMFALLFFSGWFQGMGWPACGRTMVHWWSRKERGQIVSIWNVAHNVGGGIPALLLVLGMWWLGDWRSSLYLPALAAIVVALIAFLLMKDTPQSCGLPSVEEYKDDFPEGYSLTQEKEISAREIFMEHVFPNKLLWMIAFANVFVYLVRYGALDWAPSYLLEKGTSLNKSSLAYFLYEYAAIPGTILCGWMSDKIFKGNRGLTGVVFMILTTLALIGYWLNPAGNSTMDVVYLTIVGFLIYGPVMLIGLHALELVPKKAAGTAAGFTGLFGYLGGSMMASVLIGYTVDYFGWTGGFLLMIGGSVLSIILLLWVSLEEKKTA